MMESAELARIVLKLSEAMRQIMMLQAMATVALFAWVAWLVWQVRILTSRIKLLEEDKNWKGQ